MNKGIFITGTDTGVGKTLVTGFLSRFLREKGYRVATQKWARTGSGRTYSDIKNPYAFKFPGSPHLASRIEGKRIFRARIINSFKKLASGLDFVIVEGTGGCLVPIDHKHLLIDIAQGLGLPAVIVMQNKLGAINHGLLTAEAIKRRKIKIIGAVFNNLKGQNKLVLRDNPAIIKRLAKIENLGVLPWSRDRNSLYKIFKPIANRVLRYLLNG